MRAVFVRAVCVGAVFAVCGLSYAQKLEATGRTVSLANLPVLFEPNLGQAEPSVRYIAHSNNVDLQLYRNEFELRLRGDDVAANVALHFLNSSSDARISASDCRASQTNYLLGRDPSQWRTHIPNFGRVTYSGLYPGVDVVFYGNGQELEHDFVVAPGADYRAIRIQISGAQVALDEDGRLRLGLSNGDVFFTKPEVYQIVDGSRHELSGSFMISDKDQLSFFVADYDHSKPLVIDPVLVYSTFLANLSISVSGVAADSSGNAYVTGETGSSNFPITSGAFQSVCASCGTAVDVFVMKLTPDGSGLVYSTFLGGSGSDQSGMIATDSNGNAIVVGFTGSTDFPLKNQISHGYAGTGTGFGFITSLSADGSSLNYSSILGGGAQPGQSSSTGTSAIAIDTAGNAYISGTTDSPVFPVTPGALNQGTPAYPKSIVFISKFSPTGALLLSSLIGDVSPQNGGGGPIGVADITFDAAGNAYITGTGGTLWPTTAGAYQTQIPGTAPYAAPFVAKLSSDASSLAYSTFLGPSGTASGIAVNTNGEAIVSGQSAPTTFPTTSNAYEPTASGCCPSYLSRFSADGSSLPYSTFYYGNLSFELNGVTSITGLVLDSEGDIWLAGITNDLQLPMQLPIQSIAGSVLAPSSTGFVSEFDPSATNLKFSTYIGSPVGGMWVTGPALDGKNRVHIAGTANYELYTSPGAYLGAVSPQSFSAYGFAASIDPTVAAPAICFASSADQGLWFGSVTSGTSSTLPVKLTNCGTLPLSISSLQISSASFAVPESTNGCQSQVAVNASCTLSVTFSPTSVNAVYSGTLTIASSDSFLGILPLGGNSASLALAVQGSSLATVTQGNTATYTLNIGGQGLSGTPTLTCTGAPNLATCTLPPSIQIDMAVAQSFTVSIRTTAPRRAAAISPGSRPFTWQASFLALLLLLPKLQPQKGRRILACLPALVAIALLASCGGSSGSPSGSQGTPRGTYAITVTATEPLASVQSVQLSLTVQ